MWPSMLQPGNAGSPCVPLLPCAAGDSTCSGDGEAGSPAEEEGGEPGHNKIMCSYLTPPPTCCRRALFLLLLASSSSSDTSL